VSGKETQAHRGDDLTKHPQARLANTASGHHDPVVCSLFAAPKNDSAIEKALAQPACRRWQHL